ncbi:MAG: hypothetical protein WCO11_04590 [Sphingomonadales bacterium]|jgi:hypothetical protein
MANPLARLAVRAVAGAASRQIAARVAGANLGPAGTLASVALPFLLRRVSPLGLAAMAVGAWGVGKLSQVRPASPPSRPGPLPVVTPAPTAWSAPPDGH